MRSKRKLAEKWTHDWHRKIKLNRDNSNLLQIVASSFVQQQCPLCVYVILKYRFALLICQYTKKCAQIHTYTCQLIYFWQMHAKFKTLKLIGSHVWLENSWSSPCCLLGSTCIQTITLHTCKERWVCYSGCGGSSSSSCCPMLCCCRRRLWYVLFSIIS